MTRTKFHSEADFIQSVAESKHQYDARRSSMSFEEKLRHPNKQFCQLFGLEWLLPEARGLVKDTEAGRIQDVRIGILKRPGPSPRALAGAHTT